MCVRVCVCAYVVCARVCACVCSRVAGQGCKTDDSTRNCTTATLECARSTAQKHSKMRHSHSSHTHGQHIIGPATHRGAQTQRPHLHKLHAEATQRHTFLSLGLGLVGACSVGRLWGCRGQWHSCSVQLQRSPKSRCTSSRVCL